MWRGRMNIISIIIFLSCEEFLQKINNCHLNGASKLMKAYG